MRAALSALASLVAGSLLAPAIADSLALVPVGLAAALGWGLARGLLSVAAKLQSDASPRRARCPPRRTSSPR